MSKLSYVEYERLLPPWKVITEFHFIVIYINLLKWFLYSKNFFLLMKSQVNLIYAPRLKNFIDWIKLNEPTRLFFQYLRGLLTDSATALSPAKWITPLIGLDSASDFLKTEYINPLFIKSPLKNFNLS